MREYFFQRKLSHEVNACIQGDYTRCVDSAAFKAVRQEIRLFKLDGRTARSALHYGGYRELSVGYEKSRSRRTVQCLMTCGAENIDAVAEFHGYHSASLRAVCYEA